MVRKKSTGFAIRRVSHSEIGAVTDMWKGSRLATKPRGRDSTSALRNQQRQAPDLFLGAYLGDELIGSVIASDDGRRGWINRLSVLPAFRRQGVGEALVKAAENALRRRGRHLYCIHVESDNRASMKLFEKAGYARQREILYFAKRERKSY